MIWRSFYSNETVKCSWSDSLSSSGDVVHVFMSSFSETADAENTASSTRFSMYVCSKWNRTSVLGLCDMDKKYISRFCDFFFDFDFNHDFDTNRHALSYTSCFCTSYLFLHILLVFAHFTCFCTFCTFYLFLHILLVFAHLTCLAHLVLHFSLFYYTFYSLFLFFTYINMLLCGVTFI